MKRSTTWQTNGLPADPDGETFSKVRLRTDRAVRRAGQRANVSEVPICLPFDSSRDEETMLMTDLPVACTLSLEARATRRQGLLADLLRRADAHEVLADGHRWSFAATDDLLAMILGMVEAERRCCRFLRFQIIVEPDGGPVSVDLTGPTGTREFVTALFES